MVGTLLRPVALQGGHQLDAGVMLQCVHETFVAINGGRGAFQTHHFQHTALAVQLRGNVLAHDVAHLVVVGGDKGGVFLGIGLALEYDDGDALVVGAVDGRRNGLHLIGSHDEQVNTCTHEAVNLLHLSLVAVIGCCKAQFNTFLKIGLHAHLGILLLTPDVGRALRHAYNVAWLLTAAPDTEQHRQQ